MTWFSKKIGKSHGFSLSFIYEHFKEIDHIGAKATSCNKVMIMSIDALERNCFAKSKSIK